MPISILVYDISETSNRKNIYLSVYIYIYLSDSVRCRTPLKTCRYCAKHKFSLTINLLLMINRLTLHRNRNLQQITIIMFFVNELELEMF